MAVKIVKQGKKSKAKVHSKSPKTKCSCSCQCYCPPAYKADNTASAHAANQEMSK